jgi:immunoglobulin I-set domain protein
MAVCLAAWMVGLGSFAAKAATINVYVDPSQTWNGYENVFTNGVVNTTYPTYMANYLGTGNSFANQSSIDGSGNVTCAPDIRLDQMYPADTLIWHDASTSSTGICKVISDIYLDSTSIAAGGDTVIFSGTLVTNGLAAPYSNNVLAFIKDFSSTWGYNGMASVYFNTLTNGQSFTVAMNIAASGDHVQWGFEWAGPPARSATVNRLGSVMISSNTAAGPTGSKTVNVYIDPSQQWVGYENYYGQAGLSPGAYWYGSGRPPADVQGSISASGTVLCAPDVYVDKNYHLDTNYWYDSSGSSTGACSVTSTFYVDRTGVVTTGDQLIFRGMLATNGLADPYTNTIIAFIKEFNSTWGGFSMSSVNLNTLTNGEQFTITKDILNASSGHFQWGFEWSGPPARTNNVAGLGYAVLSSNTVAVSGPQILAITPTRADVTLGSNATFTANATGSGLKYQWSKSGQNLTNGPGISGATTNVLALTGVQGTQEGTYTLVVTDSGGLKATNQASLLVFNPGWLYFDRALAPFNGYINVWNGANLLSSPPASGAAGTSPKASFGFGVTPTTMVRASMDTATDTITLQPNTYVYDGATNTMDPNYINPDGTAAAYFEQDYYIQNDALTGDQLIFAGYCVSNSLNAVYTARAWIKDGSSDWSAEHRYDTNLVSGQPFVLTLPTPAPAGDHIQYGFAIWGPGNSATNPITKGAAVVQVYSPFSAKSSGSNIDLAFPTVLNHAYTVQYKTNLTDSSWSSFSTTNGTGSQVTVPDSTRLNHRFYRLQIH